MIASLQPDREMGHSDEMCDVYCDVMCDVWCVPWRWCLLYVGQVWVWGVGRVYSPHVVHGKHSAACTAQSVREQLEPRTLWDTARRHMWTSLPSTLASFIKSSRGAHLSLAKVIFGYLCEYFRVPTLAAGSAQNNLESDIITRVWH